MKISALALLVAASNGPQGVVTLLFLAVLCLITVSRPAKSAYYPPKGYRAMRRDPQVSLR